jgi:type II secretory pathway component GspD/PulD (secretin)
VVQLKLDLKIESLGTGSNEGIPVLNNRQLTSMVTIPAGQSALLASQVTSSETKAVQGIPGLSELPGFQSTSNENKQTSTDELLITITPHVVRSGGVRIASRPLLMPYNPHPSSQGFTEEQLPPPAPEHQPAEQNPQAPATAPHNGAPLRNGMPAPESSAPQ